MPALLYSKYCAQSYSRSKKNLAVKSDSFQLPLLYVNPGVLLLHNFICAIVQNDSFWQSHLHCKMEKAMKGILEKKKQTEFKYHITLNYLLCYTSPPHENRKHCSSISHSFSSAVINILWYRWSKRNSVRP